VRFPYRLYRRDGNWVAPFAREESRRWDPKHNPSLKGRWHQRFLALRDARVVGRIAASTDPAFAERWEARTGFFGFFECEDDPEAARALLDAAGSALHRQGIDLALGPVNLSMHDESGLLVEGFDTPPMVLSPYNGRYVPALLESAGCRPRMHFSSYLWTPKVRVRPAVARVLEGLARENQGATHVRVRRVDLSRFDDECRLLLNLYNETFRNLWGFVPMSHEEFRARAKAFRAFLRPELILVLEVNGIPEGFCLALPDVNAALLPLRGRLWPFGWMRLMRSIPNLDTARLLLLGVRDTAAGRRHALRLAAAVHEAALGLGLRKAELSVVQSRNAPMRHIIEAFGAPACKTYRLYERDCDE